MLFVFVDGAPPMKLHGDPKIPSNRRGPRRPHHSHKLLDVTAKVI
jgi:hypothetical protein